MKKNRLMMLLAIAISGLLSCQKQVLELQKEIVLKRQSRLQSFTGQLVEQNVYRDKPVQYDIQFKRPLFFKASINSPKKLKNIQYLFTGETLVMYFPAKRFAYKFINLPPLGSADQAELLSQLFDHYASNYKATLFEGRQVAGKPTVGVQYLPIKEHSLSGVLRTLVFEDFAFPLQAIWKIQEKEYISRFEKISFNPEIATKEFKLNLPRSTQVTRINYKSKNLSPSRVRRLANFTVYLPTESSLPLKRIVKAESFVPGFTAHYRQGPFETYVSMVKDYGIKIVPDKGLLIKSKNEYYLSLLGIYSMVYFKKKGAYYMVVSNLPPTRLLAECDSFAPVKR